MTIPMIFNDLCLRTAAPDRATARQWMNTFVHTLMAATDQNLRTLRMQTHLVDLMLAPDYPMRAWINDSSVEREAQDFVLDYFTRYPPLTPYDAGLESDDTAVVRAGTFECRYEGELALGLGYAYLLNGLAIGLLSEPCWDRPSIELDCLEIEPITGELQESREAIPHAARPEHLSQVHRSWITAQLLTSVTTGEEFWQQAAQWFPQLVFCENARRQLQSLPPGTWQLPRIIERLFDLNRYCSTWLDGGFDGRKLANASPESQQTLNMFGQDRVFVCPDGEKRLFEWHLKGLPHAWRIHIYPDQTSRRILVGYIGKHLPTATDPT